MEQPFPKTENNDLVSVILPVFNAELYIKRCLDSLINQTYKNIEIIIIDDGSTDNTKDLIEPYISKHNIKYFYQENKGIGSALNYAISKSKGKYIARMDADDICMPNRIELQAEFLKNNKDIDILGSQAINVDGKGNQTITKKPLGHFAICMNMFFSSPMIHPTYMVRNEVYKKLSGYKNFSPGQDYELLVRAKIMKMRFSNLPIPLVYYSISSGSLSSKNITKMIFMNSTLLKYHLLSFIWKNTTLDSWLSEKLNFLKMIKLNPIDQASYLRRNQLIQDIRKGKSLKWLFLLDILYETSNVKGLLRMTIFGYFQTIMNRLLN